MKAKVLLPIFIIISFTLELAFHFTALADIDAPHNESTNVSCGKCHGEGLLQSFWGDSGIYSTVDKLCLYCHTDPSCPLPHDTIGPKAETHTDSDENILAECIACHDPHYQEQKNYKSTDSSNLYLAYGRIESFEYNDPNDYGVTYFDIELIHTSVLTYSSITYKNATGWDAAGLSEKTWDCRGAILFPNVKKLGYSYPIIAVNEGSETITVKGDVTPVYQYITSSDFAVMYGQFIKDQISVCSITRDKSCTDDTDCPVGEECSLVGNVKFFDKKGANSYADGDTTYNGICEVCHTQTIYHRNDGLGESHYPAVRCSICHTHVDNFAETDHTGKSGPDCEGCHGHDDGWNGGGYFGTTLSHSTHTENDSDDLKGPFIDCDVCHDTNDYPFFRSGTDGDGDGKYNLSETDVCDSCHSPGGAFDGVNDAFIGAKNNWTDGVYESPTLKSGKEKWCAGCHDGNLDDENNMPGNSKADGSGIWAPGVIGDNTTYGFYISGHKISCLYCHDSGKSHIDEKHRTYEVENDGDPEQTFNSYNDSYRLKDGSMVMPRPAGSSFDPEDFHLCFLCHNPDEVMPANYHDTSHTNFYNAAGLSYNNMSYHILLGPGELTDSDWDGVIDSMVTCLTCHNVHGSPTPAMMRHGELISTYGTTDKVPGLNFSYLVPGLLGTATFISPPLSGGDYDVHAWIPADVNANFTTEASYNIYHDGSGSNPTLMTVDQSSGGGERWAPLGNYTYNPGSTGTVVIDNSLTTNVYVVADAIRWKSAEEEFIVDNPAATFDPDSHWYILNSSPEMWLYNGSDFRYSKQELVADPEATLTESLGGIMNYNGQHFNGNKICNSCHAGLSSRIYRRIPNLWPKVMPVPGAVPNPVPNDATGSTTITVTLSDPDNNVSGVYIDLSPVGSSATQAMTFSGNDAYGRPTYSYVLNTSGIMDTTYTFEVTATDADPVTGVGYVTLTVYEPGAIVLDDTDATFVTDCIPPCDPFTEWSYFSSSQQYETGFRYKARNASGTGTVTWTPDIPTAGNYQVYAWWDDGAWDTPPIVSGMRRSENVPYTITYDSGSVTVYVDQTTNGPGGGKWNLLATYPFAAGTLGYIVVSDNAIPAPISVPLGSLSMPLN